MSASLDGILYLPAAAGGTQILDANGNPSPFVLGSPCNTHGCSTVNGGSGVDNGVPGTTISPDTGRENLFAYLEHDFGDSLTVFGQIISGEAEVTQRGNAGLFPNPPGAAADRAFTIYSGNPFLPASIQQAMTANNVASVLFGRIGAPEDIGFDAFTEQTTETDSLTGGFEYDFQGDGFFGNGEWQLNGYYQTGETDVQSHPARRYPPRSHLPRVRRRHGPSQRSAGLQRHGDHTRYCQPALSRLRAVEPLRPRQSLACGRRLV